MSELIAPDCNGFPELVLKYEWCCPQTQQEKNTEIIKRSELSMDLYTPFPSDAKPIPKCVWCIQIWADDVSCVH